MKGLIVFENIFRKFVYLAGLNKDVTIIITIIIRIINRNVSHNNVTSYQIIHCALVTLIISKIKNKTNVHLK